MAITDIPLLSMLRTRMQWQQERQRVLAENVANSDMPNFRPRDLVEPKFDASQPDATSVSLALTDSAHIATSGGSGQFGSERKAGYEIRPSGNAVNLEDEMLKVAQNQMDHQTVTQLYSRGLGLIKIALGKK